MEQTVDLKEALQQLGIKNIFTKEADLSAMTAETEGVCVSQNHHFHLMLSAFHLFIYFSLFFSSVCYIILAPFSPSNFRSLTFILCIFCFTTPLFLVFHMLSPSFFYTMSCLFDLPFCPFFPSFLPHLSLCSDLQKGLICSSGKLCKSLTWR